MEDAALAYTCRVAMSLLVGGKVDYDPHHVAFVPQLDENENFIAQAFFERYGFDSPGDGSYVATGGTPGLYVTNSAANMAGFAIGAGVVHGLGNRARRKRAERDAQPRWMLLNSGDFHLSTHGIYFQPQGSNLTCWSWGAITQMSMVGPNIFEMVGNADTGDTITWRVRSPFAELAFACWASVRNKKHPQLRDGSWLPPGWLHRAVQLGRVAPASLETINHYGQLSDQKALER